MSGVVLSCARKTTVVTLEVLAVILLVLAVLAGLFAWRMTAGPIDVSFAKPYIENALHDEDSGTEVSFGSVVVHWPDISQGLYLQLRDVSVSANGKILADVAGLDLLLSRAYLLIGQIKPVQIVLNEPSLHLIRTIDNEILFLIDRPQKTEIEDEGFDRQDIVTMLDGIFSEEKTGGDLALVKNLRAIEINGAQAVIEDHVIGMTWYLPSIDLAFARSDDELMMSTSLDLPGAGGLDSASAIRADITYNNVEKMFNAAFFVQDFNPHFLSQKVEELAFLNDHYVSLNGEINISLDNTLELQTAQALLSSKAGIFKLEGIYEEPFRFQKAYLDVTYDHQEKYVDLRQASLTANNTEVNIESAFRYDAEKMAAAVTVNIPEISMDNVPPIWPHPLMEGEPIEDWMLERLSAGRLLDTEVKLDIIAEKTDGTWQAEPSNITGRLNVEDMTVDYRAPLRKITNATGSGTFGDDILTINVDTGDLGDLAITDSRVVIDEVIAEGKGGATIDLNLKGPVASVFDYIEDEPINKSAADIGIDGSKIKGMADLKVNLSFPTKKDLPAEEVKVKASGTLTDTLLPGVVRGLDITGGPLNLELGEGRVALSGNARLDGRPVKLEWEEYLEPEGKPYAGRVEASLTADKALRDHFGIGLEDWITGAIPIELTYTEYQDNRAEIDIKGDLTPAILMVAPFDYTKPRGKAGSFTTTAIAQGPNLKEIKDLTVKTDALDLQGGRLIFETIRGEDELRRGVIERARLNENDLKLEFEIGASGLIKMEVNGPFLDARPFLEGKGRGSASDEEGDPFIASVSVDRMRTNDKRLLEQVTLYIDLDRQSRMNQLEMDAIAGRGDIYFRFKPDRNGIMTVRLEAGDAGATLRAFDVYENVRGGTLVVEGRAKNTARKDILHGNISLNNFRVSDAPVLARILGAMGPTAIPQLLGGQGLSFARLESEFDWHIRENGDLYIVNDGRTSGSSLGLTFEGTVDKARQRMDLKGTVVPVSMINNMIGEIPLIGNILMGGQDGALIAATYKVEGPADNPRVTVNPLAALAPGFLRKLLFEGAD